MSKKSSNLPLGLTSPRGFAVASCTCGIKPSGSPDLALIVADDLCAAAGVFTTNKVPGAPVIVSKEHLRRPRIRAIVCNSGVSNVCTGAQGLADARRMCERTAQGVGCRASQVLVCSTGVIGKPLPMAKIEPGIAALCRRLSRGPEADAAVARAILTTDLVTKTAARAIRLGGATVRLAGIAKGSGMIAPNMATMLAFITTDAAVSAAMLQRALGHACRRTFNRISVDHDTSTSDSLLILASGKAGHRAITAAGRHYRLFLDALTEVCEELAHQIIKDGEGATRVFRVRVIGARSEDDADRVGHTIVGSPLVKTAVHGGDPNWGRILAAAGRSGAAMKPHRVSLHIDRQCVFRDGRPLVLSAAQQRRLNQAMQQREITFTLDLNLGRGEAQWLGCDLSRQYIAINADYTT